MLVFSQSRQQWLATLELLLRMFLESVFSIFTISTTVASNTRVIIENVFRVSL